MTVNHSPKEKKKRNRSFLVAAGTRIIGALSSLFKRSILGKWILSSGDTFNNSFIKRRMEAGKREIRRRNSLIRGLAEVFDNGLPARAGRYIASLLSTMSVAVYGFLFMMFGIVTVLSHFVSIYVIPNARYDGSTCLIVGSITAVCSIPFLSSSKSAIQLFSGGKTARKITRGLLLIPEEKLWTQKKRGGVPYMAVAGFLGMGCGVLSYFINPIYIIAAFFILVCIALIFSSPEIGIILSCVAMPFLQYIKHVDILLLSLVLVTALSYIIKLIRGRRTFRISMSGVMVLIFGCTMIIAGIFSIGGAGAIKYSIFNVIIMFGAFFLGGNLTKDDKVRRVCIKVLTVSLVVIAFLQFWNLFHLEIYEGIEHSILSDYRSVIGNTELGVSSNVSVSGLWAVIASPLIIAECFNKKRIYGVVSLLLCFAPVVLSIACFGALGTMIALVVGIFLYLLFHSSRSTVNTVLITLCAALVIFLALMILGYTGVVDVTSYGEIIQRIFKSSASDSAYRTQVVSDTWRMLFDGNWLGIGSGIDVYRSAMAGYLSPDVAGATVPGTAFMQIFCESGIFGLIVFAVFAFSLFKNGVKYVIAPTSRQAKTITLGLVCGFVAALILGWFSCIFDDVKMRYLFWLFAGLISSQINSERTVELREMANMKNTASEVDVIERI